MTEKVTIKSVVFEMFRKMGWENVSNEAAKKAALKVKSDSKWNITHLYYWRKIFKRLCAEGLEVNGKPKETKKRKSPKKVKKEK